MSDGWQSMTMRSTHSTINCYCYVLSECGSWTYQSDVVNFLVDKDEIDLGDFYDNQEWLLMDARLRNGTTRMQENSNESVMLCINETAGLKRQSFYYVLHTLRSFPL
ncbi:hypothetical protein COOONC_18887 [Cooperia oncophora]